MTEPAPDATPVENVPNEPETEDSNLSGTPVDVPAEQPVPEDGNQDDSDAAS